MSTTTTIHTGERRCKPPAHVAAQTRRGTTPPYRNRSTSLPLAKDDLTQCTHRPRAPHRMMRMPVFDQYGSEMAHVQTRWGRLPKAGERCPEFGLSRSHYYSLIQRGEIRSKSLCSPGQQKAVRLIDLDSVRAYIESCPDSVGDFEVQDEPASENNKAFPCVAAQKKADTGDAITGELSSSPHPRAARTRSKKNQEGR